MKSFTRGGLGVLLATGLALIAGPSTARATTACTTSPGAPGTQTVNFGFTGTDQCWAVPGDVIAATFDVYGAQGAGNFAHTAQGGKGAHVRTTIAVTPSTNLQIEVGGQPSVANSEQGGFNGGGGSGRTGGTANISGGGGGASDVRGGAFGTSDRLIVAGGGGGAAGDGVFCDPRNGPGSAGGGSSANGLASTDLLPGAHGGGPGQANGGGGAAGAGTSIPATPGGPGTTANGGSSGPGAVGHGGDGGGGGGGYIGGGGGGGGGFGQDADANPQCAGGGGGAGGSNFVTPSATSSATSDAVQTGNGKVVITYVAQPAPGVTTGTPSKVGAFSVVLNGQVATRQIATTAHFEYGLTSSYGTVSAAQALPGSATASSVAATIANLQPSTTYHYRLDATNGAGTTQSPDRTFTTTARPPKPPPPNDKPVARVSWGVERRTLNLVALDGRGSSDTDGYIASYRWSVNGKQVSKARSLMTRVTGPATVTLTVTDDLGATGTTTTLVMPDRKATARVSAAFCRGCAKLSRHAVSVLRRLQAEASGAERIDITVYAGSSAASRRRAARLGASARRLLLAGLHPRPARVVIRAGARGRTERLAITLGGRRTGRGAAT